MVEFTNAEIEVMKSSPDVLRALSEMHKFIACDGESTGHDCSGNIRRSKELLALAEKMEAEI